MSEKADVLAPKKYGVTMMALLRVSKKESMNVNHYLFRVVTCTVLSFGVVSCGGSSSNRSSIKHEFDGIWKNSCDYDAAKLRGDQSTVTIDGNKMSVLYTQHLTQDCSDKKKLTIDAIFDLQYKGQQATGDCMAEKIDTEMTAVSINEKKIPIEQINALLSNIDLLSSPQYDLLCLDEKGALRRGEMTKVLDGSEPDKRPTTIKMSGAGGIKQ